MWWQALGVKRDADLSEIKSAYSALIKAYRPNTHPEKFAEIRHAFEQARKHCRQTQKLKKPSPRPIAATIEKEQVIKPELEIVEPLKNGLQRDSVFENADSSSDSYSEDQTHKMESQETQAVEQFYQEQDEPIPDKNKSNDEHSDSDNHFVLKSQLIPEEDHSSDEVMLLLNRWKSGNFQDNEIIEQVLFHPAFNDYPVFRHLSHDLIAWLHQTIEVKQGFLVKKSNIPVEYLAKLDTIFGWTQREEQVFREHQGLSLNVLFALIHEGHKNYDYISSLNKDSYHRVSRKPISKFKLAVVWLLQLAMAGALLPPVVRNPETHLGLIIAWGVAYFFIDAIVQFKLTKAVADFLGLRGTRFSLYLAFGLFWLKYGIGAISVAFVSLLPISAGVSILLFMIVTVYEELTKDGSDFGVIVFLISFAVLAVAFHLWLLKKILVLVRREYASALIEYRRIQTRV